MIDRYLAHFKITAKLGEGAMGTVYRAVDTRLGRQVAIKVLPLAFTADPELLARFQREARVLASLNHPGIVAIHDLENAVPSNNEGDPLAGQDKSRPVHFLVMEFVEGKTLDEEIPEGGFSLERFFELAIPLAETLAAAHEYGVIHRDLKPGNIMVTPSGALKVLDFGLAKRQVGESGFNNSVPPQSLAQLTQKHQILGTFPYMSPEQIRSEPIDQRTDIFSLGVILFEMVADERPFKGSTSVDLISSILLEPPPDLGALRPGLPEELVDLVRHCLAKDRRERVGSALQVRDELIAIRKALENTEDEADRLPVGTGLEKDRDLDQQSVAVLPFVNLNRADEAEFLATGLHNDLITELSKVADLTVISRTSVMGYLDTDKPLPQVGRELGVGTIIEGAVQSYGSRVRLTAQLIDASTDVHRWAESYDRQLSPDTLFDIQSELTRHIIDSLLSELVADQQIPAGKRQTEDLEAYRLVTLGRVQMDRRTEDGFLRAIEHFERAVIRDPDYVEAWVGLAFSLALMEDYGYGDSEALMGRCKEAIDRLSELDPDSAGAHAALGLWHIQTKLQDGPAAVREWERAVQIQPGYADAHNWLSWVQIILGRAAAALASARRAVELDPMSAEAVSNLSLSLAVNGAFEQALDEARRAAELSPGWTTAIFLEALALYGLGRMEEVKTALAGITVEWAGLGAEATLALAQVTSGDEAAARRTLARIKQGQDPFAEGFVHLALGEVDEAFERFAAVDRLTAWPSIAVHLLYKNTWDTVRDDPRYGELVRRAYTSWKLEPPGGITNGTS